MFGGKITNKIYQKVYWCPKTFFKREHLQKLSKNVCCRTLSYSLIFWRDLKTSTRKWQQSQRRSQISHLAEKVARIQKEEYSSCQYSYLYWGKIGIQKRFGSQKHQEMYCDCRSPVSLLVWRKTIQRARTPQNNETRSPPTVEAFHFKNLRDK